MQRSSLFLCLLLFLAVQAQAKEANFASRRGVGFGFNAGITNNPFVNYIPEPLVFKRANSNFFGIGFFFDLSNLVIEPGLVWFTHPSFTGSGNGYSESGDAYTVAPQLRLRLVPVYFNGNKGRFYFGGSFGSGQTYIKNSRKYTIGNAYSERLKGSSTMLMLFTGVEMFAVQNYTIALDLGYRDYFAQNFTFLTENDTSGAAQALGSAKKTANGDAAYFVNRGFYAQLNFNLHF